MSVDRCVFILGPDSGKTLLGMPLLLRGVLTAGRCGAKNILLIGSSPEDKAVADAVMGDERVGRWELKVEYAGRNAEGAGLPAGPGVGIFWLIDGGCVFSDPVLAEGEGTFDGNGPLVMAPPPVVRKGEGAGARPVPAVVLCPAGMWKDLDAAVTSGSGALSVERFAAGADAASSRAVGGFVIRPFDGPAARKAAVKALMGTAGKPVDGFIARHFNRRLSKLVSRRVADLSVTPTAMSVINFFVGLGGAAAALSGRGYWSFVLAGALFEAASIFDGCDGELARLTWRFSDSGSAFDATADAVTYVTFFSCLAVGLFRFTGRPLFLILLGVLLSSMAVFYFNLFGLSGKLRLKGNIVQVAKKIEAQPKAVKSGRLDRIASRMAFMFRRDFFATVVFLVLAAGGAAPLLAAVVIFSVIESVYISIYSRKVSLRQRAGAGS